VALSLLASLTAGCASSIGTTATRRPAGNGPAWARICVPASLGPVTHSFDGLTVHAVLGRAQRTGVTMDFLAADGRCDIRRIPINAGPTYVHAAIANGRVVFARVSTAESTDTHVLSDHDRALALAAGHHQADRLVTKGSKPDESGWPTNIDAVTAAVHDGTISDSNTGHRCDSGQIIAVQLIGQFDIVVSGQPVEAGSSDPPDLTVQGVDLSVDEQTGFVCLLSVQTGTVQPSDRATVLYRR
jgi:hypothetical protein